MTKYPFEIEKAVEVAAAFLKCENSRINLMKLVKLVYLLDRASFDQRGIPVVGGWYLSMKNGPVTSEMLDLINSGQVGWNPSRWPSHISDRQNYQIALTSDPGSDHLSQSELKLIEEVYDIFGAMNQWELRDWCHRHCEEWTPLEDGRSSIQLRTMLTALGKRDDLIEQIETGANEVHFLQQSIG